jgi:hypothetical protein
MSRLKGKLKLMAVVAAVSAVASLWSSAQAAPPLLSGSYIADMITVCQPGVAVTYSGNTVVHVLPTTSGKLQAAVLTLTFKPGTVTMNGVNVQSTAMKMFENGQLNGSNPSTGPFSATGPYSNTSASVTLNGMTFSAAYGALSAGIVQSAVLAGVTGDTNNCVMSMRLSK